MTDTKPAKTIITEEMRIKRRAAQAAWALANPDKLKAQKERARQKKLAIAKGLPIPPAMPKHPPKDPNTNNAPKPTKPKPVKNANTTSFKKGRVAWNKAATEEERLARIKASQDKWLAKKRASMPPKPAKQPKPAKVVVEKVQEFKPVPNGVSKPKSKFPYDGVPITVLPPQEVSLKERKFNLKFPGQAMKLGD